MVLVRTMCVEITDLPAVLIGALLAFGAPWLWIGPGAILLGLAIASTGLSTGRVRETVHPATRAR